MGGDGLPMFWQSTATTDEVKNCAFALKNYNGDGNGQEEREADAASLKKIYTSSDNETITDMYANGAKQVTVQSLGAMLDGGYVPYMPYKSVTSPFFRRAWAGWKCTGDNSLWETVTACGTTNDNIQGSTLDFDAVKDVQYYTKAAWTYASDGFVNVMSRQMQKEALHHGSAPASLPS